MANEIFVVAFERKYNLVPLEGTIRQVQYASCLRCDFIQKFMDLGKPSKAVMIEKKNRFARFLQTTPEVISFLIRDIKDIKDANYWLDNKSINECETIDRRLKYFVSIKVLKNCSKCGLVKNTDIDFSRNGEFKVKSACKSCINKDHAKRRLTKGKC